MEQHIPRKKVVDVKTDHPWLAERCRAAIAKKRAAFGKPELATLRDECAALLSNAYNEFVTQTRQ